MMAPRWLALPLVASLTALGFAACAGKTSIGSSSSSSGAGGSPDAGAGGGDNAASSSGSTMPEAGPLTCKGSYTNINTGKCDMLAQDCVSGETCKPVKTLSSYVAQCVPAPGLKAAGELCFSDDECQAKLTCVSGRCARFCCPASGEPCPDRACGFTVQFKNPGNYNVHACRYSQQCQVLTQDACPEGFDCHIDDVDAGLASCGKRSDTSDAGVFDPCTYTNDCGDMQQCTKSPAFMGTRCYLLCSTDPSQSNAPPGLGGCPVGYKCKDKVGELGVADVGICTP